MQDNFLARGLLIGISKPTEPYIKRNENFLINIFDVFVVAFVDEEEWSFA
jgi:hypothetical protein